MKIKDYIKGYQSEFLGLADSISVTDRKNKEMDFNKGILTAIDEVKKCFKNKKKVIFIGNGGSAGIASHMAVDFWKNGGIKAVSFNDPSLLTCLANDYGYEFVFQKPINMFAEKGDVLFAISSSGRSKNILNGAAEAKKKGCSVITLSGFSKDNPLSKEGIINFYVPAPGYGYVEVLHQYICHFILDAVINEKEAKRK